MPGLAYCPKCRCELTVADGAAARALRCPRCDTVLRAAASTVGDPPIAPAPPPGAPQAIGPYAVRRLLGEGAFGVVYLCHDAELDRDVAVKVLQPNALEPSSTSNGSCTRSFKVVAKLPCTATSCRSSSSAGTTAATSIASAFIPGRPLADAIPEAGMEPARAVRLTAQLLDALAYAHERGVLHRDVKPANAMLVEEGDRDTLYLMDFGLAGLLDPGEARMTKDNTVMGTPSYMPPEQARGAVKEVGPASDQYSAGVVLYELLTGRVPFEAGSAHAVIGAVIHAPPPPPSGVRPGLDWTLEAICLKALAKQPPERFGSCREFADALRGCLANRRAPRPAAAAPAPPRAVIPPPRRRAVQARHAARCLPAARTMTPVRRGAPRFRRHRRCNAPRLSLSRRPCRRPGRGDGSGWSSRRASAWSPCRPSRSRATSPGARPPPRPPSRPPRRRCMACGTK